MTPGAVALVLPLVLWPLALLRPRASTDRERLVLDVVAALGLATAWSWLGMTFAAVLLRTPAPLADDLVSAPERWTGITQAALRSSAEAAGAIPWLRLVYCSLPAGPIAVAVHALATGDASRIRSMARALGVATVVGLVVHGILPLAGPYVAYHEPGPGPAWQPLLDAGRVGWVGPGPYVECPSFHAVIAVLVHRALRGTRLGAVALVWGAAQLAATPVCGWHYLVDVAAGVLLAVAAERAASRG